MAVFFYLPLDAFTGTAAESVHVGRAYPMADRFQMHLQNTATEAMPVGTPPRSSPTYFHFMVIPLTLGGAERCQ